MLFKCTDCGHEVNVEAKSCPSCGTVKPFKNQNLTTDQAKGMSFSEKSGFNRLGGKIEMGKGMKIFWGAVAAVVLIAIFTPSTPKDAEQVEANAQTQDEAPIEKSVPTEYMSALAKAEMYTSQMHMSKKGVYEQLTSDYGEQFSAEAAQYAIDNVNADYKYNALKKAETYQGTMHMSPSAIREQLVSDAGEKFTEEEAQYAIDNLK